MGIHPGAAIGANVRLIRPLSRGGMGSVWRAEHLTLHTEVAVKFVSDALIGDQGFLARFTREAVASARIKSPHVVQIFDHGVTADGVPYIVMELLEGEDLRIRLLRLKQIPLADTVKIIGQVARGLSRAHAAGVVHRDIKPGNVFLVDQDGELFVKILDFGIAKQIGDVDHQVTMTGQIIGTPHYVSPEQIQRPRDADPQSDLWSLAVVAYRCLTGDLPFEGESVGAVAIAIDKAAFTPISQREPALPRMLDAWFAKAFTRVPTGRFGSARELSAAFEAAARDEPLSSVLVDSSSFSVRNAADLSVASVAKLAPPVADVTPGAIDVAAPADARATRPEDRATRPELPDAPAAPVVPVASATDTPRRADTPLSMGEPTLSHGTVTHIELTNPRRTKIYGGMILGIGLAGAIVVGVLSSGDDAQVPGAASAGIETTSAAVAAVSSSEIAATSSVAAPPTASATVSATASATAAPAATPDTTAVAVAPAESSAAPAQTASPAGGAPGPATSATRPGGAAPAGTSTRTKNRGF